LLNLRQRGPQSATPVPATPRSATVGAIGVIAGAASGVSGAGWGPLGVKLLVLRRVDPRHAIGSSLTGRIAMAAAAVATYAIRTPLGATLAGAGPLLAVLFGGSMAAMLVGTLFIGRIGRRRATLTVAVLSISLAIPTLVTGGH
nr:TSUP family transporter [Chloroflexota bacterium]